MEYTSVQRRRLLVGGQVQGVGFRPFVYRLALRHGCSGHVGNTSDGVVIEVQASAAAVEAFVHDLQTTLPPLARITRLESASLPPVPGESGFSIAASQGHSGHSVLVSPDVATCADCQRDIRSPGNRRHGYPFTNCTNCGPRYTITRAIPYDRATTSMACFPQCPACQAEYDNPLDRRFHAQPNACSVCGPQVWLVGAEGEGAGQEASEPVAGDAALRRLAQALHQGNIAAIKGLGGFHLVCDARNAAAVEELRRRKHRPHKPLAVMVPDVAAARTLAHVGAAEEALLTSSECPIVLCPARQGALPDAVAPDASTLGLVLPYTPLHMVLLERCAALDSRPPALVMTSGNAGGEPICLGNREALCRLSGIVDIFLLHNRDILVRADDSVVTPLPVPPFALGPLEGAGQGDETPGPAPAPVLHFRRARGYVPRPVFLRGPHGQAEEGPCVLGAGSMLKATLCLTRGDAAFVSQHIGDLENLETAGFYEEVAAHLEMLLEVRPEAVVCDLHPDFPSTAFAETLARERGVPLWRMQHHFAHAWSVLAEYEHHGPALVLALDGTGLGDDGSIWGGELLWVDTKDPGTPDAPRAGRRVGRLAPFVLPGGEAAIREPWRLAQGLLTDLGLDAPLDAPVAARQAVAEMTRRRVRCLETSSAGRLFDAVGALLGLCVRTTYEGQAAIRLEAAQSGLSWDADLGARDGYAMGLTERGGLWELDAPGLFAAVEADRRADVATSVIARRFHVGLAQGFAALAAEAAAALGVTRVGLTGGVMQNATLAALLPWLLRRRGLEPLLQRDIPANDGGVSLGQAVWGRQLLLRR